MKVHPGKVLKTESHGERWWSHYKCPQCGSLCDSQRWYSGMYRITCLSCGYCAMALSALADDLNGPDGENP